MFSSSQVQLSCTLQRYCFQCDYVRQVLVLRLLCHSMILVWAALHTLGNAFSVTVIFPSGHAEGLRPFTDQSWQCEQWPLHFSFIWCCMHYFLVDFAFFFHVVLLHVFCTLHEVSLSWIVFNQVNLVHFRSLSFIMFLWGLMHTFYMNPAECC